MKRILSALVAGSMMIASSTLHAQGNRATSPAHLVKAERGLRVVAPVKGCCPCSKRWPFRQVQNPSLQLVEGQSLLFHVAPGGWMDAYVSVKNVSAETITFSVRIDTSRKDPNHRLNFCSGEACYPTFVTEADQQGYVTLQPGESDHTFKLQFDTQGYAGQTVVGVTMFNIANPNDYITFDVVFDTETLSITPEPLAGVVVWPNPAAEQVQVQSPVGSQIAIVDVLGRTVRQLQVQSNQVMVSVADLPVGTYRVVVQNGARAVSVPLQVVR